MRRGAMLGIAGAMGVIALAAILFSPGPSPSFAQRGATGPLTISKAGNPNSVGPGQSVTYTLTVTNTSPCVSRNQIGAQQFCETVSNVQVTDTVPAVFTNVDAFSPDEAFSCSVGGNQVTCDGGSFEPGQTGTIQITATLSGCASAAPSATNTAVVSGAYSPDGTTTVPTTASASTTTAINCPTPTPTATTSPAALNVNVTGTPNPVAAGQTETFTVTVSNTGGSPTSGVTLTDVLSGNFTNVRVGSGISASAAGWSCSVSGNTVTCQNTDLLSPGQSYPPVTIVATASGCGTGTNTATVSGGGIPTPVSRTVTTQILCPTQSPTPTASPTASPTAVPTRPPFPTFTATATPTPSGVPAVGPGPITPSNLPPEGGAPALPPVTVTPTPVPPQPQQPPPPLPTVTTTVTRTPAPVTTATATATSTVRPSVTATATPAATATGTTTPPGQAQPQGVQYQSGQYVRGADPLTVNQTTRVTLTYTLTNTLNVPVDFSSTVLFNAADGVTPVSADPSRGTATINGQQIRWGGFSLNAGESASISMTLDVTPPASAAGRSMVLITDTSTSGRIATGGFVEVQGGSVDSTQVRGLLNGGFVVAPTTPAAPAAPAAPVAPIPAAAPVAPAPVAAAVPVPAAAPAAVAAPRATAAAPSAPISGLPSTGAATPPDPPGALPGALAVVALIVMPLILRARRRRA